MTNSRVTIRIAAHSPVGSIPTFSVEWDSGDVVVLKFDRKAFDV